MSYIVPRSIPNNCKECRFHEKSNDFPDEVICTLEHIYVKAAEKYAFCPLVDFCPLVEAHYPLFDINSAQKYLRENPPKIVSKKKEVEK